MAISGAVASVAARDSYVHDDSVLPAAAKKVIDDNFKSKVSIVKVDRDLDRKIEYEVILTDGTEISFDRHGNWENIEVNKNKSVPSSMIPAKIQYYVRTSQRRHKIIGIEKERNGYDVLLSNGVDLKFDKRGDFLY